MLGQEAASPEDDRTLEALLSFTTLLSALRPDFFALHAPSERFAPLLGGVCIGRLFPRSRMAALTLISRLKNVDLSQPIRNQNAAQPESTVLDALLRTLGDIARIQQRAIQVLPRIAEIQGDEVLGRLSEKLESADTPGTVVIGAAYLLKALLKNNRIKDRTRVLQLMRKVPLLPIHRRPLYYESGTGANEDPIAAVYWGSLGRELNRILTLGRG